MALALILIGIIVAIFVSGIIGLILVIAGVALLFIPAVPGGYSSWRGRRAPP